MRLHLTIQRHGLPVTRILWTTSPPSLFGHKLPSPSSILPAASTAITSSRTPNALYSNGGYTIAQLLEDVNEVIPLETEPRLFEDELSGQWGLEDYVVEIGGSECLHFMEVEGLLRDGDEVLIRALQISDLRARRLSGRHQISTDGKHLIDGVPFGKPFLKRPTSSRPAIMIPPRKKRRTALAPWGSGGKNYEEEDTEWAPTLASSGKELSLLRPDSDIEDDEQEYGDAYHDDFEDYHDPGEDGDGTVIRHPIDPSSQSSESDSEVPEPNTEELTQELQDLKDDMEIPGQPDAEKTDIKEVGPRGYPLRSRPSTQPIAARKSSLSGKGSKRRSTGSSTLLDAKAVRFDGQKMTPSANKPNTSLVRAGSTSDEDEESISSESDSSSSTNDSSESSSESDEDSSSSSDESHSEKEVGSSSESESSSSESEDEVEEEDEFLDAAIASKLTSKFNPPGGGSLRTKKSNQRNKMRRQLAKLKELGVLEKEADFTALRHWVETNGGSFYVPPDTIDVKEREQAEFEAKRQKLLRDLESGGIDVSPVSKNESLPPSSDRNEVQEQPVSHVEFQEGDLDDTNEVSPEISKRRTLDVASTRRLLFGSLGVRTPKSKEDEEVTRKKLAGKVQTPVPQPTVQDATAQVAESESEIDWRDKLTLKATECVYDDIKLTTPPFPFEQHWDDAAGPIIRERNGWGKKRRRRQRFQVYDGGNDQTGEDSLMEDSVLLNYDDAEQDDRNKNGESEQAANDPVQNSSQDLPPLPSNINTLADLVAANMAPGLVFAFKQLDVSKATNWQPMVSEYRVAEVRDVFDDNILSIQLASPYRRQARNDGDGEDGPFQYSGFEMPGLDDEGEDDGFREVPFDDLIDPKLIRAAPTKTAGCGCENGESNSFATDESPIQNASMPGIEAKHLSGGGNGDQHGDGLSLLGAHMKESSPVLSPQFNGFEASSSGLRPSLEASHVSPMKSSTSDHYETRNIASFTQCPSNITESEIGASDKLASNNSPVNGNSFESLMDHLLSHNLSSPLNMSSPMSQSSCIILNPFYEVDKAREERRRHGSTGKHEVSLHNQRSREQSPMSDTPPSTLSPQKLSKRGQNPLKSSQNSSRISVASNCINYDMKAEDPPPCSPALPMPTEVVDLTQSSPLVSPGGSDKDFAKTHRLPRGSGWVKKDFSQARRQTRQLSASLHNGIGPPRRQRRRSRKA